MQPHHAGAASAALAACPSMSQVQGCMPGTPVTGWSDTRIHSRRHPTRYEQWSPWATFSHHQDMPRPMDAQLQRSKLQCCRPPRVEQFIAASATRHEFRAFQASIENITIRELVNHGALWQFCTLEILLLTYNFHQQRQFYAMTVDCMCVLRLQHPAVDGSHNLITWLIQQWTGHTISSRDCHSHLQLTHI